jgi:hypothetical protein
MDHRVDVFTGEHFAIVACREDLISMQFTGTGQTPVINIADGREFYARNRQRILRVTHSHATESDRGDTDAVVWRNALVGASKSDRGQHGRAGLEEVPSRGHSRSILSPRGHGRSGSRAQRRILVIG